MRGVSKGPNPKEERRPRAEVRKASIARLRLFGFARCGFQASSSHISAADLSAAQLSASHVSALGSAASASEQMES